MRNLLFSLLLGLASLGLARTTQAQEPGTPFCFGVGCPCGNDDPSAGCINSTGVGGLLTATGSASISASDLDIAGTQLPRNAVCLLVSGRPANFPIPFKDGLRCVTGDIRRLQTHLNSGHRGEVLFADVIGDYASQGFFLQPGETRAFQIWSRDSPPGQTPCGAGANTTNGYVITFTP